MISAVHASTAQNSKDKAVEMFLFPISKGPKGKIGIVRLHRLHSGSIFNLDSFIARTFTSSFSPWIGWIQQILLSSRVVSMRYSRSIFL